MGFHTDGDLETSISFFINGNTSLLA